MATRIFHGVDYNNDFMQKDGALHVGGADALIDRTNDFLRKVKQDTFDFAVFTYDTHFEEEYELSPEHIPFPNIHCPYGERGWQLAVDPELLEKSLPIYYMSKNVFDAWGSNPVGREDELFTDETRKAAYRNLFHMTDDPQCLDEGQPRDKFMDENDVGPDTEVVLAGVASNFCDADAMLGYLKRGCTVTVLEDLVRGIAWGPDAQAAELARSGVDRTATGDICDVLKTSLFAPYVAAGKLRLENSADFLRRADLELAAATQPPAPHTLSGPGGP
jgi:nicotinamidase-related amidase